MDRGSKSEVGFTADVKITGPDPEDGRVGVPAMLWISNRYFSRLILALTVFVPQLALLGLLLTHQARVGPFYPIGLFLVASDGLMGYFGFAALSDLWILRWTEQELIRKGVLDNLGTIEEAPGILRGFWRRYERFGPDKGWKIILMLVPVLAFAVGVNAYIGWVWFNP